MASVPVLLSLSAVLLFTGCAGSYTTETRRFAQAYVLFTEYVGRAPSAPHEYADAQTCFAGTLDGSGNVVMTTSELVWWKTSSRIAYETEIVDAALGRARAASDQPLNYHVCCQACLLARGYSLGAWELTPSGDLVRR
jgi:hypothetical protein